MWCKNCNREAFSEKCDFCGNVTDYEVPTEIYWCSECKVPVIKNSNDLDKNQCPLCGSKTSYLCVDIRPVFPEERLLYEILVSKPLEYINNTVWSADSRYYVDGKPKMLSKKIISTINAEHVIQELNVNKKYNSYVAFEEQMQKFVQANKERLNYLKEEAYTFIRNVASKYPPECTVISFSGGKDSTVVADLTVRALSNPSLVHIFGDTTLEFPLTMEYAKRFRMDNPKAIFKIAKNKEQDFYKVCEDIGPPARMLRWCCSMFKTGPITRVLNSLYRDRDILTFYGIRKCESVSRSKYKRIEYNEEYDESLETVRLSEKTKIKKQTVASPIFFWKDIDIWLYILNERIDFNDAYRLGYDRVGCWCCPNNNQRAQFLSKIYMSEQTEKWRCFLIEFARRIGKPDAEIYVDTGKWKARQGGNGVAAAEDIKIKFTNCTVEENAKVYNLNKPITDNFMTLFNPFGREKKELGRKLINETIFVDIKTNIPILSIQPFSQDGYEFAVKIKTMNVENHDDLQRMVGYQIRKYNACRKCLKCESLCKYGAISIIGDSYRINDTKCMRCKMCVTAKYLDGGCAMSNYLCTKD